MPLTLHVDLAEWHTHMRRMVDERPGLIPVAKGNGYGQGIARLAHAADRLGATTLAVGTLAEAAEAAPHFPRDILVLTPWDPTIDDGEPAPSLTGRLIRTVSNLDALEHLGGAGPHRWVLELATPLHRFGVTPDSPPGAHPDPLATIAAMLAGPELGTCPPEGLSLHLPMSPAMPGPARSLIRSALDAGIEASQVHVSHLDAPACRALAQDLGLIVRPRIGTALWIGDFLTLTGTVRAVHRVRRGEKVGYRQVKAPGSGWLIVADGGTSHGIALAAPALGTSLRTRLRGLAADALGRGGVVPSPFTHEGRRLRYADTPHAQVSLLFLPARHHPPRIGEPLRVRARHTIVNPDTISEE
jgi:hypothetical protein